MYRLITTLLLLLVICFASLSQTSLGLGLVKIEPADGKLLHLFSSIHAAEPEKEILIRMDPQTGTYMISQEETLEWLDPEVLWLDYEAFYFRFTEIYADWLKVIINNNSGQEYWIKDTESNKKMPWAKFLINVFSIERMDDQQQEIRSKPLDNASIIPYDGEDFFQIRSIKGDWAEIFTPDHYKDFSDTTTPLKSGWIRWKKGNELLIDYSLTS